MISLSVTKLASACVNEDYLNLLAKDPASTPPFLKVYRDHSINAAPGTIFHELVAKLIKNLTSKQENIPECGSGTQPMWDYFYSSIGKEYLFRVAEKNPESASNLSEALRQFCSRIDELVHQSSNLENWNNLFLASEFALEEVRLDSNKGAVLVNGRIDTIRANSSKLPILVDYKLSHGVHRNKDLIQLALYAQILKLSRHNISVDGVLEYYFPELYLTEIPNKELHAIYKEQVLPIIDKLVHSGDDDETQNPVIPPSENPDNYQPSDMIISYTDDISVAPNVLRTHTAVVGAAGSGKTWMAKVIAEEAIISSTPIIAIDPQGDLVQMINQRDRDNIPDGLPKSRYDNFWDIVEPKIYTPGTTHGIRLSLEPIRLLNPDEVQSAVDDVRKQEEIDGVLTETANAVVSLGQVTPNQLQNYEALTFSILKHLVATGKYSLSLRELALIIRDPESIDFPDDLDMILPKTSREKFARSLFAIATGPNASLFEGGQPLDIGKLLRPDTSGKTPLNIIYLNALTDDQKTQFVGSLATAIYRWMITSLEPSEKKNNLLFYLDEARDYLPAGTKSTSCKQPLIRLFTQGRKFGVGCLICTQSPRSVDYNVFGNCSSKFIGRLEASQDVDRVAEWFQSDGGKPSWLADRVGAEGGSFVGRWPGQNSNSQGKPFRSRLLHTDHTDAWPPFKVETEWREFISKK